MISDTLQRALLDVLPELNERQARVYDAIIELGRASNQQLAEYLNWPINCICPRVLELRQMGVVCEAGYEKNKAGRMVHVWRPVKFDEKLL